MNLKIDQIPLPHVIISCNDFADMQVGDSAFIAAKDDYDKQRIRGAASYGARRDKKRYICRSWEESDIKGIRVWRVG